MGEEGVGFKMDKVGGEGGGSVDGIKWDVGAGGFGH